MKINKILTLVMVALGGILVTSIVNSEMIVTPLEGEIVSYTLNSGFDTVQNFTAGVLEIDDGETKIYILDRNLGATTSDISSTGSFGYYFQWGNNYGFPSDSNATINIGNSQINCNGFTPLLPFIGNTFIGSPNWSFYDYCLSRNDNMWGGGNDNNGLVFPVENAKERQGPCPDGYHVPSKGEWYAIMDIWAENNVNGYLDSTNLGAFMDDFNIPLAGHRCGNDASIDGQGEYAIFWSSSPLVATNNVWRFHITENGIRADEHEVRVDGYSVRCFKDKFTMVSVRFWDENGGNMILSKNIKSGSIISADILETLSGYIESNMQKNFFGRYVSGSVTPFDFASPITEDIDLYASWDITYCEPNDADRCITMMDRNLGATKAGINCTASDHGACGYHYQRGNNYGFTIGCWQYVCQDSTTRAAITKKATYQESYDNYGYTGGTRFIRGNSNVDYWSDGGHDGLRGGSGDSESNHYGYPVLNPIARKGPCPDGYHVPSAGEWNEFVKLLAVNYMKSGKILGFSIDGEGFLRFTGDNVINKAKQDLLISFVGHHRYGDADVGYIGSRALFRSSSPVINAPRARSFELDFWLNPNGFDGRGDGRSIRCFKNSTHLLQPLEYKIIFDDILDYLYDKSGNIIENNILTYSVGQGIVLYSGYKDGYVFDGWKVDMLNSEGSWLNRDTVTNMYLGTNNRGNTQLKAEITPIDYSAFYNLDGGYMEEGEENPSQYNIEEEPFVLNNPIKTGYTFVGRTGSNGTIPQTGLSIFGQTGDLYFSANWAINEYKITFVDGSGEFLNEVWTGTYGVETTGRVALPVWIKTGYVLSWSGTIPATVPAEDIEIIAIWIANQYTITFDTDGGSVVSPIIADCGAQITPPTSPIKNGYYFYGRDKAIPDKMPAYDMVIKAQWVAKPTSNGGSVLNRDVCPNGDYSDSYYDGKCGKQKIFEDDQKITEDSKISENSGSNKHNSADEVVYDTYKFNPKYSDDMNKAYQYSYHYGITTKSSIKNADMNGKLTRIAMAKMLSQYATNVLGKAPDISRNNKFVDVSDKLNSEYDDGVTLAYQLGIMGINMPNNEFMPYNYVTRAEFATALSRLLYETSDGEYEMTPRYYTPHINKLAYEGILTNTDPMLKELRGYVMLMLMRSVK